MVGHFPDDIDLVDYDERFPGREGILEEGTRGKIVRTVERRGCMESPSVGYRCFTGVFGSYWGCFEAAPSDGLRLTERSNEKEIEMNSLRECGGRSGGPIRGNCYRIYGWGICGTTPNHPTANTPPPTPKKYVFPGKPGGDCLGSGCGAGRIWLVHGSIDVANGNLSSGLRVWKVAMDRGILSSKGVVVMAGSEGGAVYSWFYLLERIYVASVGDIFIKKPAGMMRLFVLPYQLIGIINNNKGQGLMRFLRVLIKRKVKGDRGLNVGALIKCCTEIGTNESCPKSCKNKMAFALGIVGKRLSGGHERYEYCPKLIENWGTRWKINRGKALAYTVGSC
ncbi:hypothetical protein Tco_0331029 [Tanacetum coccineum]